MQTWTPEQVLALAPDAASAKNGRGLAIGHKWFTLGTHQSAVWGECQGSGKNPYRTQIDLSEPAFRCSCPSRKFPCKHGLALFLLLAE
ncbi:MAG: SWIM zinc finger family protein, partial [Cyanobacteria bacterium Co-bin8]|nr:SWIM zinc finger family protein [Cyanobacteria bacterium Co-bin8]